VTDYSKLTAGTRQWLSKLEENFSTNVAYAQTSPKDTIDLGNILINENKKKEGEYALD
jgi:hypothetical protein